MTLGELIAALEAADPTLVVERGFHNPHSYRGYYEDLAFEPARNITVGEMLDAARSADGATYTGWKGGEFTMGSYTDVWLSLEGDASGDNIGAQLVELMLATARQPTFAVQPPAPADTDLRERVARIVKRLTAHAKGFGDVLEDADSEPWGRLVCGDIDELRAALDAEAPREIKEDPARIDRIRPEFTEHSSVEAIDAQLQRAQAQERRWHIRTEWLISLRETRIGQKARGEWPPAPEAQQAECGAELTPRTGTRPCILPAGHDGTHHQDRHTNRWPVEVQAGEGGDESTPAVCEGFQWIGQSFATCDRCGQPAWEHVGEDIPVDRNSLFDDRRTVRPWEPGEADRIRAKWGADRG